MASGVCTRSWATATGPLVSAPAWLQRQRVLRRPGMTADKLAGILAKQMPDAEKRRRADVVVPTSLGKRLTWRRLRAALPRLRRARQPTLALWTGGRRGTK